MGSGSWSDKDWKTYATTSGMSSKSTHEIYKTSLHKDLDPKKITFREARDSADNPTSNAVIIGLDVTGSMGMVLDVMARTGLPTLMKEIYDRKPVAGPQVCCMAIGDAEFDNAPLQVTQFESDIRIATDLEKLYLEQGGGGNRYEGYALAWYFAALHTKIDCFEKRGKKGYLFTIGDEEPTPQLYKKNLVDIFGPGAQADLPMGDLLTMASRQWEIFHLIVEEGSNGKNADTHKKWKEVLGQRALHLADHTKMAEVIVSTIQVAEGTDHATVTKSWDGSTGVVVSKAIRGLTVGTNTSHGVVTL
jgi:hypothetical protein